MEHLLTFFNQFTDLSDDEVAFVKANMKTLDVPKNHILLAQGAVSKAFYFIVRGSVRMYYIANGEEKTAFFYTENMFVSSYQSFTKQVPAKHNLASIEASQLIVFDLESVGKYIAFSPKFEFLARVIMEDELAVYQEIISSFVTQNAEQRYVDLLANKPDLLQRIPQHQIATFLGVSPETLSRIRHRLSKR